MNGRRFASICSSGIFLPQSLPGHAAYTEKIIESLFGDAPCCSRRSGPSTEIYRGEPTTSDMRADEVHVALQPSRYVFYREHCRASVG